MAFANESIPAWWWADRSGAEVSKSVATSSRMKNVVSGTCGGITLVAMGHPFDTIKVKLQCQSMMTNPGRLPLYTSAMDCLRKTTAMEGFNGLYKGVASPLAGQMLFNACLFMTHDEIKLSLVERNGGAALSTAQKFQAGAMTGAVVSLIESPTDLFKSKMQLQSAGNSTTQYASTLECAKAIVGKAGIRGMYQGLGGTVLRNTLSNGLFFGIYDVTRSRLEVDGQRTTSSLFSAGATAGFACTICAYPFDVVKSSLQADSLHKYQRNYRGVIDCATKIYARQGWRAFTQGLGPSLIRGAPGGGLLVVTVETVRSMIGDLM
eukprot:CAMPEP_0181297814 /NCGR_PEP_ID=MMETSP1101-20121128/5447_1 /TAXON_ID=46948 /ORGANISM="Rhodomonas abbreviata, Strain Caron Lab Isolate" /LENGTH=320 /DNA_ID=CAMNT_0023402789 /DNA_START=58 /DNA_END=1020 /DNA_ORIENTATION=-